MSESNDIKIELLPNDLIKCSDENLFTLLVDLQKASSNLFTEAWRRGIHTQLAEKGMQMKHEGPSIR